MHLTQDRGNTRGPYGTSATWQRQAHIPALARDQGRGPRARTHGQPLLLGAVRPPAGRGSPSVGCEQHMEKEIQEWKHILTQKIDCGLGKRDTRVGINKHTRLCHRSPQGAYFCARSPRSPRFPNLPEPQKSWSFPLNSTHRNQHRGSQEYPGPARGAGLTGDFSFVINDHFRTNV